MTQKKRPHNRSTCVKFQANAWLLRGRVCPCPAFDARRVAMDTITRDADAVNASLTTPQLSPQTETSAVVNEPNKTRNEDKFVLSEKEKESSSSSS